MEIAFLRSADGKMALAEFLFAQNLISQLHASQRSPRRTQTSAIPMQTADEKAQVALRDLLDSLAKAKEAINEVYAIDAQPTEVLLRQEEAKTQLLAEVDLSKLNAITWKKASAALDEASTSAGQIAAYDGRCTTITGSVEACRGRQSKHAWVRNLDVSSWNSAAKAVSQLSAASSSSLSLLGLSEGKAKKAWLSKLDVPTWVKASKVLNLLVAEATQMTELDAKCTAGDAKACQALWLEDEAKRAWLAKLDGPSWLEVATTVSQAAATATALEEGLALS
jgi:hypothetical protein